MYSEPEYITQYMRSLHDAKKWPAMPYKTPDMWRVPVYKDDDAYAIVVQPDRVRYFTAEALPDFMKASL